MEILKAAMLYFSFVSAVGFLLGPMRNLWTNARVGPRSVTLIEAPIMLVIIALGAWLIVRRRMGPPRRGNGSESACWPLVSPWLSRSPA